MGSRFSRVFGTLVGFGAAVGCGYAQRTLYAADNYTVDELSGGGAVASSFGLQANSLALGSGGVMYAEGLSSDGYSGEVWKLNRNGTTTPFAQIPGYEETYSGLVYNQSGGNFYALDYNPGNDGPNYPNNIYSISPAGVVTLFASINGLQATTADGIAMAPDGDLYVAIENPGLVLSIDKITPNGTISVFDSYSNDQPVYSMAFNAAGDLFYGQRTTVQELTPAGVLSTYATLPTVAAGFYHSVPGLAFDSSGALFASDSSTNEIYQILPSGASVPFSSSLTSPAALEFGNATPEPSASIAMGLGLMGLGFQRRRLRTSASGSRPSARSGDGSGTVGA